MNYPLYLGFDKLVDLGDYKIAFPLYYINITLAVCEAVCL